MRVGVEMMAFPSVGTPAGAPPRRHGAAADAGRALALVALALLLCACGLPRDPDGTLERVRNGVLRVGATQRPPWLVAVGTGATGVEARLIESFAASLGARVRWHWGSGEEHLAALAAGQLDLVAGGLEQESPWARRVGTTRPYVVVPLRVGVASGTPPSALDGLRVAVEEGSALATAVARRGGHPLPSADPWSAGGAVAAPEWVLVGRGWRFDPDLVLAEQRYVLAVPPGENAFLVALERSILAREDRILDELARSARSRR
jgi:polar amino acid transport system substrate-binding protein